MTKKQVAWTVTDESTPKACVVFHHHGLAARRLGAEELGEEFEYLKCRRSPEFDHLAESGKVPTQALLDAGWWFECNHCGEKVIDEEQDDYVVDGEVVFCNASCKSSHEKYIDDRNHKFELFKDKVKSMRPDLEFTEFQGGYPWITNVAKFTFPGAKYGGSVRDDKGDGKIEFFIAGGDMDTWNTYEESRKGKSL